MGQLEDQQSRDAEEGRYVPFPTEVSAYNLKKLAKRRQADRKVLVRI